MWSFVIALALLAQPSSDLDALCMRVADDSSLMTAIADSAAQPNLCMSQVLRTEGLTIALGDDASRKCGLDAEIEKAAVAIKGKFPDVSDSLAKNAASKCVGWLLLHSSLKEGKGSK